MKKKLRIFSLIIRLFCFTLLCLLPILGFSQTKESCVQIYYDQLNTGVPEYQQVYSIFLKNLLGHFTEIKNVYVIPINNYKRGQLNTCQTNFYIGYYSHHISQAFLNDFMATSKTVVWINDNVSQLGQNNIKKLWDSKFTGVVKLDWNQTNKEGEPGFYKDYEYKGEVFPPSRKSIPYRENPDFGDIALMEPIGAKAKDYTVAWAKHNTLPLKTPYVLHNKNRWYIANIPFTYIEKGSYLIFCDLLFDILNLKPRYTSKKPGLIRIEDVNAGYTDPSKIVKITNSLNRCKVPFSIALIPVFKDPLMFLKKDPQKTSLLFSDNVELYKALLYAKDHGASFIWHGVTHQYYDVKNPFNGMSGADFEFWDAQADKPIKEDSVEYVLKKLQLGADILGKTPIKPIAWMTPHYLASPLDYTIFGQVFLWQVGKVSYLPGCKIQDKKLPISLTFDHAWPGNVNERLKFLSSLKVRDCSTETRWLSGQFFPYEIFKDVYGQRIIPENLGNLQPYLNNQVIQVEGVQDILETAKRNRVLRDAWASFFIHPSMLNSKKLGGISSYDGDTKWLEDLVTQIESYGYEFVDLNKWTKNNSPPPKN